MAAPASAATMRAAVRYRYGGAGVIETARVRRPSAPVDGVLVRVAAASVNRLDWHSLTGTPYVARPMFDGKLRPKSPLLGTDFAGTVEAVGSAVTGLRPGDEVYGASDGAFAEYVAVCGAVALKPRSVSFEEAAAVPVAGITALQGLRDHGRVRPGHTVLINGASGGVGTYALQIAKALGAEVTAVCSTPNVGQAHALGAGRVIDYAREDFSRSGEHYDVLLDIAGNRSWRACRRVVARDGIVVLVGGPKGPVLGPLGHIARGKLGALLSSQNASFAIANVNHDDLGELRDLIERGDVKPVIERRYSLDEAADALRYAGEGHARGKVVISV
jgi:NADPH:quinone reductase-like Zn-dependent oxidoreductase